jgi:glycosyltransferase involved in cell wall biosynthesis
VAGTFEARPRVEVTESRQEGVRVFRVHRSDLYFDRWEKTYCPQASRAFAGILDEVAPDVVHVHHFIRLSRDLVHRATQAGVPAVVTLHDFATTCLIGFRAPGAGSRFCDLLPAYEDCVPCASTVAPSVPLAGHAAFGLHRADLRNELVLARARLAVSRAQREKLARYHGLAEDQFQVVPLAPVVDLPRGMPAPEPPPLRVATWGVQMERKGAHVLLEAVRQCAPGSVEADVFGRFDNADYEARCRALARRLPVRFAGRFEWDELAATPLHASVFPSLTFETFGLTFDESRALGHPVIATELGAYAERADAATVLFASGDSGALAAVFTKLAADVGQLAGLRAAVAPPEPFSRYVDAMESIYARAVAAGPPPRTSDAFDPALHPDDAEFDREEELFRRRLSSLEG